jgi:alkanesulfonate monooxygenase SsuD/methylene tetrahydromethanopterin reductase-like flavin-dependent oxidoreductase (luciferase family)
MKTFRFGVNVGPSRSRAEWAEKARKLEDFGYATLTVPDHLTDFFAPMPALISAAEATKNFEAAPTCSTTTSATPCWSRVRLRQSICLPRAGSSSA